MSGLIAEISGSSGPPNETNTANFALFFGTVIHETLDRAHAHYRGEIEGVPKGSVPADKDVAEYFAIAERSLLGRGIRPLSKESRNKARRDARLHRRQRLRHRRRMKKLFNLLQRFGLLPPGNASTPDKLQENDCIFASTGRRPPWVSLP